jgi:hypothetical protein
MSEVLITVKKLLKKDRKRPRNAYIKSTKCYELKIFSRFSTLKLNSILKNSNIRVEKREKTFFLAHDTKTQLYISIPLLKLFSKNLVVFPSAAYFIAPVT